jgi:hypothetical protein
MNEFDVANDPDAIKAAIDYWEEQERKDREDRGPSYAVVLPDTPGERRGAGSAEKYSQAVSLEPYWGLIAHQSSAGGDVARAVEQVRRYWSVVRRSEDPTAALIEDRFGRRVLEAIRGSERLDEPGGRERVLMDVRYVLERLSLTFSDRQAAVWLLSYNYSLNGRPVDVLLTKGSSAVLVAVEAQEQNAYG